MFEDKLLRWRIRLVTIITGLSLAITTQVLHLIGYTFLSDYQMIYFVLVIGASYGVAYLSNGPIYHLFEYTRRHTELRREIHAVISPVGLILGIVFTVMCIINQVAFIVYFAVFFTCFWGFYLHFWLRRDEVQASLSDVFPGPLNDFSDIQLEDEDFKTGEPVGGKDIFTKKPEE